MDILLATNNEHKKKELERLFTDYTLHLPSEFGIDFDCVEDGESFSENAQIKAKTLFNLTKNLKMPVLADDSGLVVEALPGELGVKTNRFGSKDGEKLLSAEEKNKLLIEKLKNRSSRKAYFVTVLFIIFPDGSILTSEGRAYGYIMEEPVGNGGFGYDPVFFNDEAGKPSGLLTVEEKNAFSHRGKAARQLMVSIKRHLNNNPCLSNI